MPCAMQGKTDTIFGNLAELCEFHERVFEPELRKYASDFLPEDVGHCFVSNGDRLAELYADYCANKVASMHVRVNEAGNCFQKLQVSWWGSFNINNLWIAK